MRRRPRIVVDTNIIVSAILWQGTPGQLLNLAGDRAVQLYTSRILMEELAATLAKPKLAKAVEATGLTVPEIISAFRRLITLVRASPLPIPISRDPDDDHVLACAQAARADLIISGDKDLLVLRSFAGTPILNISSAVALVEAWQTRA